MLSNGAELRTDLLRHEGHHRREERVRVADDPGDDESIRIFLCIDADRGLDPQRFRSPMDPTRDLSAVRDEQVFSRWVQSDLRRMRLVMVYAYGAADGA